MPSQYRQTIFVLRASCSPSDGRHVSPVDRAREHTSHRNPIRSLYWRSKARSPHWASVTAVSPGHKSEAGAHQKFGAQVLSGCSWRIGSVLKIAPFGPSPAGGTRRFATLHSACHRAGTFLQPRGKTYREKACGAVEQKKWTTTTCSTPISHRGLRERKEQMEQRSSRRTRELVTPTAQSRLVS